MGRQWWWLILGRDFREPHGRSGSGGRISCQQVCTATSQVVVRRRSSTASSRRLGPSKGRALHDRTEVLFGAPGPRRNQIDARADVRPHQYLGPVHDVVDNGVFVSVCVPHPTTGWLAWMNIWSCTRGRGVHYACLVSDEELASWRRQGWSDEYLNDSIVWLGPADW